MNELDSGDDGDNRLDENDPHRLLNIKLDIPPFPMTATPVEPSGNGNSKSATTASKKSSKKKAKETKKVRRS